MSNDDTKLAEDHVRWYMKLLRSQFNVWLDITEKLMIENFIHGIKHGRELETVQRAALGPDAGAEAKSQKQIYSIKSTGPSGADTGAVAGAKTV